MAQVGFDQLDKDQIKSVSTFILFLNSFNLFFSQIHGLSHFSFKIFF